jgi:hypothetical protein
MIRRDARHALQPFRLRTSDVLPPTADVVVVGAGVRRLRDGVPGGPGGLPGPSSSDARPRPATLTTPAATGAFAPPVSTNAEELALVREGIELYTDFAARPRAPPATTCTSASRATSCCARDEEVAPTGNGTSWPRSSVGFGLDDDVELPGRRRGPRVASRTSSEDKSCRPGFRAGDRVHRSWSASH